MTNHPAPRTKRLPVTVSADPVSGGTLAVVIDTRHRPMLVTYTDDNLAAILRVLDHDKFWYYVDLWFGDWEEWERVSRAGVALFPTSTPAHVAAYAALTAWLNDICDEHAIEYFERRDAGD